MIATFFNMEVHITHPCIFSSWQIENPQNMVAEILMFMLWKMTYD